MCIAYTINTATMSIQSNLAAIEKYLAVAKAEDTKLANGTKSSAAKVRAALLEIGKECSESRKLALDCGKAIPTKKRVPKEAKSDSEELPDSSPALERAAAEPEMSDTPTIKPAKRGRRPKLAPVAA